MTRIGLGVVLVAVLAAWPEAASAHRLSHSVGKWSVDPAAGRVEAVLEMDVLQVEAVADRRAPSLPAERRAWREQHAGALMQAVLSGVVVADGGRVCQGEPGRVDAREDEDVQIIALAWRCEAPAGAAPFAAFSVRLDFLERLPGDHRHLARFGVGERGRLLRALTAADRTFEHDFSTTPEAATAAEAPPSATLGLDPQPPVAEAGPSGFAAFFAIGLEHIVFGWDHLLFLLALLAVGGSFGALVKVVTAFTVAHSVTLAVAVLGLVSLDDTLVEATIAASIVVVALDNLRRREAADLMRWRWVMTFAFGLVHGFGFAGFLTELELPAGALAVPLAAFNLGVEAGQLALVALAWPALRWAQSRPWHRPRFVVPLSCLVALAGGYWLWERTLGA